MCDICSQQRTREKFSSCEISMSVVMLTFELVHAVYKLKTMGAQVPRATQLRSCVLRPYECFAKQQYFHQSNYLGIVNKAALRLCKQFEHATASSPVLLLPVRENACCCLNNGQCPSPGSQTQVVVATRAASCGKKTGDQSPNSLLPNSKPLCPLHLLPSPSSSV